MVNVAVVLDANAIIRDYHLTSAPSERLLSQARRGEVEIVVPEVVVMEVLKHFRDDLETATRRMGSIHRYLPHVTFPTIDVEREARAYEDRLVRKLREVGAKVMSPNVTHDEVMRRAVERRPPFTGSGGKGYQDTLIWETAKELAPTHDVVLVSNNYKDFGGDEHGGGLHDGLEEEFAEMGAGRVSRHGSISSFLDEFLPEDAVMSATLTARLQEPEYVGELKYRIESAVWESAELEGPGDIADASTTYLRSIDIERISDVTVVREDDDSYYLIVSADGYADIEFPMLASEAWGREDDAINFSIDDPEHHVGEAEATVKVEFSLEANYHPGTDTIEDFSITWSHISHPLTSEQLRARGGQ